MSLTITKTYTLVDPDGRTCSAEVGFDRWSYELEAPVEDSGPCSAPAVLCVNIKTVTFKGRTYEQRVGFCAEHPKRQYLRWFKVTL